jgi:hypothetical protein
VPAFDVEGPVLGEVFVLYADSSGIHLTGPCGAAPWHIEVAAGDDPMPVVRTVVERVLGRPLLLHSTSWRRAKNAVMLSFVAVVDPQQVAELDQAAVGRAELARNTDVSAPARIDHGQVLEHGLRHLAWLAKDDPQVAGALDDPWHAQLASYVPEPFRALG